MALQKYLTLRQAAAAVGISPNTLRLWLEQEGIWLPRVRHGARLMVREADVQKVVDRRRDARLATR